MTRPKNHNLQRSSVDNAQAHYENVGAVYNAPVSHQKIVQDNSATYDVDKEDTDWIERWSMFLMSSLGESKTILMAIVAGISGAGSLLVSVYRTPSFLAPYTQPLLYVAIVLIMIAIVFWWAVQYRQESRCAQCDTFYAMKEIGSPIEREVRVKGGVRQTTTRTYGCSDCSHEVTKRKNRFVPDEESD